MNWKILLFTAICVIVTILFLVLFIFDKPQIPQLSSEQKDIPVDFTQDVYASVEKTPAEEWLSAIEEEASSQSVFTGTSEQTPASICKLLVEKVQNNQTLGVIAASRELVSMGNTSVPELILLMNNGNPTVETLAMGLLIQIGTSEALGSALCKLLTTPRDSPTRPVFIRLFTSIQSHAIPEVLVKILGETKDQSVRDNITEILLSLNPYYVLDSLVRAIEHYANKPQSSIYAIIMAQLANPSLIPTFQYLIENNTNPTILWGTAMGLANIGGTVSCEILAKNITYNKKSSALCARALSNIKSESSLPALMAIVGDTKRISEVRNAAGKALGNYSDSNIISQIQYILRTERDETLRVTLQDAIVRINTNAKRSAIPPTL